MAEIPRPQGGKKASVSGSAWKWCWSHPCKYQGRAREEADFREYLCGQRTTNQVSHTITITTTTQLRIKYSNIYKELRTVYSTWYGFKKHLVTEEIQHNVTGLCISLHTKWQCPILRQCVRNSLVLMKVAHLPVPTNHACIPKRFKNLLGVIHGPLKQRVPG